MMLYPPIVPLPPSLVGLWSLAPVDFGRLGAFPHDSLHTRRGGVSRLHEPAYILPSSQSSKKVSYVGRLCISALGLFWEGGRI